MVNMQTNVAIRGLLERAKRAASAVELGSDFHVAKREALALGLSKDDWHAALAAHCSGKDIAIVRQEQAVLKEKVLKAQAEYYASPGYSSFCTSNGF